MRKIFGNKVYDTDTSKHIITIGNMVEDGLINFDFGSWEVTLDIDDVNWVKMTPKGKSVFDGNDLSMIEWLRSSHWNKTYWEKVREGYRIGRFGEC